MSSLAANAERESKRVGSKGLGVGYTGTDECEVLIGAKQSTNNKQSSASLLSQAKPIGKKASKRVKQPVSEEQERICSISKQCLFKENPDSFDKLTIAALTSHVSQSTEYSGKFTVSIPIQIAFTIENANESVGDGNFSASWEMDPDLTGAFAAVALVRKYGSSKSNEEISTMIAGGVYVIPTCFRLEETLNETPYGVHVSISGIPIAYATAVFVPGVPIKPGRWTMKHEFKSLIDPKKVKEWEEASETKDKVDSELIAAKDKYKMKLGTSTAARFASDMDSYLGKNSHEQTKAAIKSSVAQLEKSSTSPQQIKSKSVGEAQQEEVFISSAAAKQFKESVIAAAQSIQPESNLSATMIFTPGQSAVYDMMDQKASVEVHGRIDMILILPK